MVRATDFKKSKTIILVKKGNKSYECEKNEHIFRRSGELTLNNNKFTELQRLPPLRWKWFDPREGTDLEVQQNSTEGEANCIEMAGKGTASNLIILAVSLLSLLNIVRSQVLVPPYFNLALDRRITATATCGAGEEVTEPELYCKLTGSNPEVGNRSPPNLIQGQFCDYCDPRDPMKSHPAEQAIDGTEKWWQSPPLSRGMDFNEVNITINLGQVVSLLLFCIA